MRCTGMLCYNSTVPLSPTDYYTTNIQNRTQKVSAEVYLFRALANNNMSSVLLNNMDKQYMSKQQQQQ